MADKGPLEAIIVARDAGIPLRIAAKMRDKSECEYFDSVIAPLLSEEILKRRRACSRQAPRSSLAASRSAFARPVRSSDRRFRRPSWMRPPATLREQRGRARATTAPIRHKLIAVPARIASSARRITLHLPTAWPWETAWTRLFAHGCGPPAMAAT